MISEFSIEPGERPGSVILRRKAIPGAKSYVWEYCTNVLSDTEAEWTFATATSKATVRLENLSPLTRYRFRVAAVTAKGILAFNDPIMHIVT